ncbi:MAG: serine hydrolase domain-containing protein [Hyphomonadaceae bacterium]
MFTRRMLAAAFGAGACAAACSAQSNARGAPRRPAPDDVLHLMDVARAPGLTYAVLESGRITASAVHGVRRAGEPATATTFFDSASLAKPVYATAILALADEGVLDLDRPLQAYLPMFSDTQAQSITARHVLSHTTGLPNWDYDEAPIAAAFPPGSQWAYSGEAFFMLQRVVEHLTSRPLADLLQHYVFGPAGMMRSTIVWSDAVAADNASPHDNSGDLIDDRYTTQAFSITRAAYVATSGVPMARWTTDDALRACTATGDRPYPGNTIPNPAYGLWTNAAEYAQFLLYASGDRRRAEPQVRLRGALSWGLGWGLEQSDDGFFAWHHGDGSGVKNCFMLHLPSQTGIVIFANSDNGAAIYRRMIRGFFEREFDTFLWV